MKRLSISLLLLLLPLFMLADGINIGGIYYRIDVVTGSAIVTYAGSSPGSDTFSYSQDITIPASVVYNGITYPVTSIGDYAFKGCTNLSSVAIPNSVKNIGRYAFSGCGSLKSIAIPNSVTSIGDQAFYITGLTSVNIPNSVTSIGDQAFYYCKDLTSVNISNSATSIPSGVFSGCSGLTSITIPNSVKFIGFRAFSQCTGLTSITIPNSVDSIAKDAFEDCRKLTGLVIPNSVTYIGESAFFGCSGLIGLVIPNSVTYIGEKAFSGCSGLTGLVIPNSVKKIGYWAFFGCENLMSIDVNWRSFDGVHIDKSSFAGCTGATLYIPNGYGNLYKDSLPWSYFMKQVEKTISLNKTSLFFDAPNGTEQLVATVTNNKNVTWTSSNTSVATVNGNGVVLARDYGTAIITASAVDDPNLSVTCTVTVGVKVNSIVLNKNTMTLSNFNPADTLKVTALPNNAINKEVIWKSSNILVATVSSSGVVSAKDKGTAIITAETTDGSNLSATCTVSVNIYSSGEQPGNKVIGWIGNPINSVGEINAFTYYLLTSVGRHGSDGQYACEVDNNELRFETVKEGHSTNATFQFEIVDDTHFRIRTISGNYIPTPKKVGWFTVSADNPATLLIEPIEGVDGQFTLQYTDATSIYLDADHLNITNWDTKSSANGNGAYRIVPVRLSDPVYARSVSINPTSLTLTSVGQTALLTAIVSPDNTSNKTLIWESSNTDVATVSSSGVVTAVASGTAVITATTVDGSNKIGACDVTVDLPVLATNVALNKTSLTLTSARDSAILIATVYPDNATDKTVTWTSSNTDVATVNSSGVVCAVDNGTAIITATTVDGSKKVATCFVTVGIKVNSIILNKNTMTLGNIKSVDTLMVTVLPNNALNKAITWTSSNTDVATVNSDGIVVAKDKGTAIITAKTTDGSGLSATCVVTVTISPSEGKIISMIGNPIKNVSEINANSYYLLTSVGRHGSDGRYLCEVDNDPRFEIVTVGHSANAAFQFEIVDDTHFRIRTITGNYFPESGGSNGWFATSMENPATFFIEPISGAEGQFTLQYTDTGSMYLDANSASISRWSIKSSANGNGAYRIVPVTLTVQEDVPVLATGVTLNEHSLTLSNIGDTVTLIATVSPDTATDKSVTWTSSNTEVATVNNNGVVTAVANGTATITATTADGTNKTATCEVTVDDTSTGGIPGDVNGDGKVNGADVVAVINYVLAASTASEGDVNGDGKVNGADIVATINYVLSFTGTRAYEDNIPTETRRLETMFDYSNLFATTDANGISLAMEGGEDYTAFQFILTLPEKTRLKGVVADENRIGSHSLIYSEMADGRYLVLGYENGNRTIVGTSGTLLKLFVDNFENGMATISDVKFFTPQAETYKLRDVSIDLATGIGYISSDMTNGDVYDAHGRRVMTSKDYEMRKQNLPAGFYIRNGRKFIVR